MAPIFLTSLLADRAPAVRDRPSGRATPDPRRGDPIDHAAAAARPPTVPDWLRHRSAGPVKSWFRRLPLVFGADVPEADFVQFSVDSAEAAACLPPDIAPVLVRGRAVVSLVNVRLRRLRITSPACPVAVSYRHVGMRLLVERDAPGGGRERGVVYLRSFAGSRRLAVLGDWMTNFRHSFARVESTPRGLSLGYRGLSLRYRRGVSPSSPPRAFEGPAETLDLLQAITGAFSVHPTGSVYTLRVVRPDGLPLDPLPLASLETGFFRSAHPEFSFRLRRSVSYVWLAPIRDGEREGPQGGGSPAGTRSPYDG